MMGRVMKAMVAAIAALGLASCAEPTPESCRINYTTTGAAVGMLAGAAAGTAIAAIAGASGAGFAGAALGGALLGAAIGAIAGAQQDKACHELARRQALDQAIALNEERQRQQQAAAAAQRSAAVARPAAQQAPSAQYQSVAWANQMTSNSGTITPLAVIPDSPKDQVCMTYADQQVVNGQPRTVTGKACRGSDGQWKTPTS